MKIRASEKRGLPPALPARMRNVPDGVGRLAYYFASPDHSPGLEAAPLLLIHSVNVAASAREIQPLFEHYRHSRPVFAPDLPGFGHSERSDRSYTPRLMTDAILEMAEEIRRIHGPRPLDALAVSLSTEFLSRAAVEARGMFRSVAMVSPTGFDVATPPDGRPGHTFGKRLRHAFLRLPPVSWGLFKLLVGRKTIRYFLERTLGPGTVNEGLFEYACLNARQEGAAYAPVDFIAGYMSSADIRRVHQAITLPVWLVHGAFGSFSDCRAKAAVAAKSNWTFEIFPTGALPYFEDKHQFIMAYDKFLEGVAAGASRSAMVESDTAGPIHTQRTYNDVPLLRKSA